MRCLKNSDETHAVCVKEYVFQHAISLFILIHTQVHATVGADMAGKGYLLTHNSMFLLAHLLVSVMRRMLNLT